MSCVVTCDPSIETIQAPSKTLKGKDAHAATAARIRAEKGVAKVPCSVCRLAKVVCWVRTSGDRCAHCAGLGKTVNECAVARDLYESASDG